MPDDNLTGWMELFEKQLKGASQERREQSATFERVVGSVLSEMRSLRWELRLLLVGFLVLALARDGVLTKIGIPGLVLETHAAEAPPAEPVAP